MCTHYMGTGGIKPVLRCSCQPQCHRGQLLAQMALTEALGTDGARLSNILIGAAFQTKPEMMLCVH